MMQSPVRCAFCLNAAAGSYPCQNPDCAAGGRYACCGVCLSPPRCATCHKYYCAHCTPIHRCVATVLTKDGHDRPATSESSIAAEAEQTKRPRKAGPAIAVTPHAHGKQATISAPLAHASVGFEWQVAQIQLDHPVKQSPTSKGNVPSKVLVLRDDETGISVESDCGEGELITEAVTWQGAILGPDGVLATMTSPTKALTAQFATMDGFLDQLSTCAPLVAPAQPIARHAAYEGKTIHVRYPRNAYTSSTKREEVGGRMQASIALELYRVPELLCHAWVGAGWAVKIIDDFYPAARKHPNARAILCLAFAYNQWLSASAPSQNDGPKQTLPLMARTDFCSMYSLLSADERAFFEECVATLPKENDEAPLMRGGYDMEGSAINGSWGPTYGEWLRSMFKPVGASLELRNRVVPLIQQVDASFASGWKLLRKSKDLLSPPPFYDDSGSLGAFTYAMGKYGLVSRNLVLFEVRETGTAHGCTFATFRKKAFEFADFAFATSGIGLGSGSIPSGDSGGSSGGSSSGAPAEWARIHERDGTAHDVIATPADGHCFYHAFVRLGVTTDSVATVRETLAVHYDTAMAVADAARVRANGYATDADIQALVVPYPARVIIHEFSYADPYTEIVATPYGAAMTPPVHMLYRSVDADGHFDALN